MKKPEGNKLVAVLLSAGMATALLAACSINTDELGQGISDLGNAFTSQTERQTEKTKATTESTETEIPTETTVETTAAETPTPTPTATPSPTPLPQRVDFSDYTEIDLTDVFTVTVEEFGESAYSDDNKTLLSSFGGNRLVVTDAVNENVRDSINLIIDGFYSEAEGAYNRVAAKAKAEYKLSRVIETPSEVTVDFQYTTNGRAFSVLMVYEVKGVEEDENTVIDFVSFDMLSGQCINFSSISVDPAGLEDALKKGLENSLKIQPTPAPTEAPASTRPTTTEPTDEEIEETEEIVETTAETEVKTTVTAAEIEAIYIAPGPATADAQANNAFATIYGISDGKVYSAVIDINAYADFLNRYGTSVFFV